MMSKVMVLFLGEDEEYVYQKIMNLIKENFEIQHYSMLEPTENIQFGEMRIDVSKRIILINDSEVMLTNKEFEILYLLAQKPGRVFSKEQIYDIVWNEPYCGDYNIVMSHIRNIRVEYESLIGIM